MFESNSRRPLCSMAPALMLETGLAAPVQRSPRCQIRSSLYRLTAAQNCRRHVLKRSQCGAGHADELQSRADPVSRSKGFADAAPYFGVKRKPSSQLVLGEQFRDIVLANISRLNSAHRVSFFGELAGMRAALARGSTGKLADLSTGNRTKWHVWVDTFIRCAITGA